MAPDPNKQDIEIVFANLKKYNLKETEKLLVKELENAISKNKSRQKQIDSKQDISAFFHQYAQYSRSIEMCLNEHKFTLNVIRFFLLLFYAAKISVHNLNSSLEFLKKMFPSQDYFYQPAIAAFIADPNSDALRMNLIKDRIILFISPYCKDWLTTFFDEFPSEKLEEVIEAHFVFKDITRDHRDYTLGIYSPKDYGSHIMKFANMSNILVGVPDETFFTSIQQEFSQVNGLDIETAEEKKRGRKKTKKDPLTKITIPDDCPDWSRIPLPNILEAPMLRANKLHALEQSSSAQTLGSDMQPSICQYTLFNSAKNSLPCAKFSDDSQILVAGYENSEIQVWHIGTSESSGLRTLKKNIKMGDFDSSKTLNEINNLVYEEERDFTKHLIGHSDTISGIDLLYDNSLLISSSFDSTIRLWSLNTWNTLTVYKGHLSPVWDVSFGPFGHYFVSSGSDKLARLWSVEQPKPLRLFCGHMSDISKSKFHPNSNYILTSSDDCTVSMWDVLTGKPERTFVDHHSPVTAIAFSADGKKCASGDSSGIVHIWDIGTMKSVGKINVASSVKRVKSNQEYVTDIKFGRDNKSIAIGTLNSRLVVGNIIQGDGRNLTSGDSFETIGVYRTKKTPITELHFTYNNMILSAGAFSD